MKAVLYEKYGAPEAALQFKETPKPVPVDQQVLVKVHMASVNAKDWRSFTLPSLFVRLFSGGWLKPKDNTAGTDVAGVVEAIGENVVRFKPGDEVFGFAHGSFAEYALARESYLALKPDNRSFQEAACVPIAALTALQAIRSAGGIHAGQQVLIQGASGGVGMFTVQLAKHSGAEVTAVCSARNFSLVHSWGADHVIDYTNEDFTKKWQTVRCDFGDQWVSPTSCLSAYAQAAGRLCLCRRRFNAVYPVNDAWKAALAKRWPDVEEHGHREAEPGGPVPS